MTATMTTVNQTFGSFMENADGYSATFTQLGSDAIAAINVNGDTLTVNFRHSNNTSEYTYNAPASAVSALYDEVVSVLCNGEGSVGRIVNQMIRTNKIQLI